MCGCGSMVGIQSPTAEIRRGKKEERRKIETTIENLLRLQQYIRKALSMIELIIDQLVRFESIRVLNSDRI